MKDKLSLVGYALGALFFVYFVVASITFGFRHPWATSTERLIYIREAMTFKRVTYQEMRQR
jgi:hypothetical protein